MINTSIVCPPTTRPATTICHLSRKMLPTLKISCTYWRFWFFVAFMSIYVTSVNLLLIVAFASIFHLSDALWVVLIKSHIMTNIHCLSSESPFMSQIKKVCHLEPKPLFLAHPRLPSYSLTSLRMGQGDAYTVQARKALHPHGTQISNSAGTIMKHWDPVLRFTKETVTVCTPPHLQPDLYFS